jgi:hypothetical protein
MSSPQPDALSAAGPEARELYRNLLEAVAALGPFREEIKRTAVHLVRSSAFIGVHPRKRYLILTVKSDTPVRSRRVFRSEQVSRDRYHLEIKVAAAADIDSQLMGWIGAAYDLCA